MIMYEDDLNKIYSILQKSRFLHGNARLRIIQAEMAHLTSEEFDRAHNKVTLAHRTIEDRVFAKLLAAHSKPVSFDDLKMWVKQNYPWLNEANLNDFIKRCVNCV